MNRTRFLRFVETASVLLFFLQALRVIVSVMFGITFDQVYAGPMSAWLFVSILLVLSALLAPALLAPALRPGHSSRGWLVIFVIVAALGRVTLSINQVDIHFWGSLIVIGGSVAYLATLMTVERSVVLPGLVAALALDQLFRVTGQTYDVSLQSAWFPIQVVWGVLIILLAAQLSRRASTGETDQGGLAGLAGLAFGGALFLETSLLALPNAVARWSGGSYAVIAPLLLVITILSLFPALRHNLLPSLCRSLAVRLAMGGVLALAVMVGYFLTGPPATLALLVAQVIALAGLICILDSIPARPSPAGRGLALGLFLFLILNLFNAFAFTYPYALPLMRGMGWVVYLFAALLVGVGLLAGRVSAGVSGPPVVRPAWVVLGGLAALAISLVAVWPRPPLPLPDTGTLRIATYNIHYGYDGSWHFNLEEMARCIEDNGVNIIALQEVDTGRLTSYGVDDAYYLARRLRMNAIYQPTVEHLTGVALLFHGPAEESDRRLLTSLQEQTGIVHVVLPEDDGPLSAYGIWIGLSNEDTGRQIREALEFIGDETPAVFGGDFNSDPGGYVFRAVEGAGFVDPFAALGIESPPFTAPAVQPARRIDYVWLRGLNPVDAWVADCLASDHRMVVVEVKSSR